MQEDGLFRRSPSSALLRQVQQAYDRGHVVSLDTFGDPHLAAVLLKKYLRDLPDPIFPESTYANIRRCPPPTNDPNDMGSIMYIREAILSELPQCAYILLSHILRTYLILSNIENLLTTYTCRSPPRSLPPISIQPHGRTQPRSSDLSEPSKERQPRQRRLDVLRARFTSSLPTFSTPRRTSSTSHAPRGSIQLCCLSRRQDNVRSCDQDLHSEVL